MSPIDVTKMPGRNGAGLQFLPPLDKDLLNRKLFEIRNRYHWLLQFGGERVIFLKRIWTGQLCSCYDVVRRQSTRSECPECFGTSYKGGYYQPIEIMASLVNPTGKQVKIFEHGMWVERTQTNWTLHDPELAPRDILVTKEDLRLEISEVEFTSWGGSVLRQNFSWRELESLNIAYKVPINDPVASATLGLKRGQGAI